MRGIRRISIPAISATSGWITTTSSVIDGFLSGDLDYGKRSCRRLLMRQDTLSHKRRARRGALLPLPDVPTGAWCAGGCLAYRVTRRLYGNRWQSCCLPFLSKGVAAFLWLLRHTADLARGRQPAVGRC